MSHGLTRRHALVGLSATLAAPRLASSQAAYPGSRAIRIVVPFAAGGTTDITGRFLAEALTTKWGTSVVVENVPGAGTNVGVDRVAKSNPDGTTIGIITPSIVTNPFLMAKMPYDPEADLMPLSLTVKIPNLLVVKKDLPVNSVAEFVAYLKANPGKLNFASSAAGSTIHLSGELFKRATGTDIVHVAYRGSAPALNDLLAGHVDLMFGDLPTMIAHVREGRLKGLGVTSAERYALTPDLPAIAETVPGFDVFSFFGVAVRAGTPRDIADKIEADCIAAAKDAVVREKFAKLNTAAVGSTAAEFASLIRSERDKWGKLITELKIKIE